MSPDEPERRQLRARLDARLTAERDGFVQTLLPPFEACVRDGRIYGRGTGDNKGQHLAHVLGYRAWRTLAEGPRVNVTFLLDGEEEIGSPGLPAFVERHRERLAADLVIWSDGAVHDSTRPSIDHGVRGVILFELHARDDARGVLHSGNWGGVARNPGWSLVQLLASMLSPAGAITIDGFHDGIEPPTPAERAALAELEPLYHAAAGELGVKLLAAPEDRSVAERLVVHPVLTLEAMKVGDGGEGARPVVPTTAVAYCDVRLVPGQRVERVVAAMQRHVERHAPGVELVVNGSMEPSRTPFDAPFAQAVRDGVRLGTGVEPLRVPAITVSAAIFTETALAFLGLGDPTQASLGKLIENAYDHSAAASGAWWVLLPPGILVAIIVASATLVGLAVEDALSPRSSHVPFFGPQLRRRRASQERTRSA